MLAVSKGGACGHGLGSKEFVVEIGVFPFKTGDGVREIGHGGLGVVPLVLVQLGVVVVDTGAYGSFNNGGP